MRIVAVVLFGLLAGCTTMDYSLPTAEEWAVSDDYTCKSYGLKFGSDKYVECRQQLAHDRSVNYGNVAAAVAKGTFAK